MAPRDRPVARLNDVGDVVLEDVRQLRALAEPTRLALFEWLQKQGPQTAGEITSRLGLEDAAARQHLAILIAAGLVEEVQERLRAIGRGLFLPPPSDDPAVQKATRALGVVMLRAVSELPRRWLDEVEPTLDPAWAAAAGLFNAGVALTRAELELVQQELERILEPYLKRPEADRPDDAGRVRVLAWFLPESDPRPPR